MRVPCRQLPTVVRRSVSAAASTANQVRLSSLPRATTVRHTPLQAIDAPTVIVSGSYPQATLSRSSPCARGSAATTSPISVTMPVNILYPLERLDPIDADLLDADGF